MLVYTSFSNLASKKTQESVEVPKQLNEHQKYGKQTKTRESTVLVVIYLFQTIWGLNHLDFSGYTKI